MNAAFIRSLSQIFKGAVNAFQAFPAAIFSALAFALVTMIRIQLDWPQQEAYNFLFNCLHWAFALGAVFSLAAITASQSRFNKVRIFLVANLMGAALVAVTFLMLYLFGKAGPVLGASRFAMISDLSVARVSVAILVSFLVFIVLAGYPKERSDFTRSLFMTQKALFIALIYGGVIMGGISGVAGAIQALLYPGMSEKVYMYIAALVGFLSFTIFVGYFPDFRKGQIDEHREAAQNQPRFIEILFGYVMVPIALAFTVVLLIWAGKTVVTGTWPVFVRLSAIATGYAIGGIWLHMMVTHYETGLAKFYRRVYPMAALMILVFEAWALFVQLNKSGLKVTEYFFIMTWILAVAAAVLLIILKAKAHPLIIALICVLAVFSVLPVVGYHALPVTSQVNRLESLLVSQGMLVDDRLIPPAVEPDLAVREAITDAVVYLAGSSDAKLPVWFDKRLGESDVFKIKLGFEQVWPKTDDLQGGTGDYMRVSLMLPPGAVDISDYRWAVNMQEEEGKNTITIEGDKGLYRINWSVNPSGIPVLKIMLNDDVILERDMNAYIHRISAAFPPDQSKPIEATLQDMSLQLETPEVSVLLVFSNVDINLDPRRDTINYWFNLKALYIKEKS